MQYNFGAGALLTRILRVLFGPLAVWTCLMMIRDPAMWQGPADAGAFVIGLMLGPPAWFGIKVSTREIASMIHSARVRVSN